MEAICRKIAKKLTASAGLSGEKQAVAVYGMLALMQLIAILALVAAITLPLHCFGEAMLVFVLAGLLRRFIGGAHAGSLGVCTVLSTLVISGWGVLCHYGLTNLAPVVLYSSYGGVFLLCAVLIFLLAPVDNKNKRVTKPEKIKRLRRGGMICLLLLALATGLCLRFFLTRSYGCAIGAAALWQCLMLPVSHDRKLRVNIGR